MEAKPAQPQVPAGSREALVPLVVGVTGHRDLRPADLPELEKQVDRVLGEIDERLPGLPRVLLSSLADGADRLVARRALRRGYALHVPLPFRAEEYQRTFESDAARREFRDLLARAKVFRVSPRDVPEEWRSAASPDPQVEGYAAASAYVVRHSLILIALWNGRDSGKRAGTAMVVGWAEEGPARMVRGTGSGLDRGETALVAQIVTPRRSTSELGDPAFSIRYRAPRGAPDATEAWATLEKTCERLRAFNRDAAAHGSSSPAGAPVCGGLLSESETFLLPPSLEACSALFRTADLLAIRYQSCSAWALRLLFAVTLIAVGFFEVYAHLSANERYLQGFIAAFFAALGVYLVATWRDLEPRHLEYRALAEGLRVQLFWRLAGIFENAGDHYLHRQRCEVQWIRIALLVAEGARGVQAGSDLALSSRIDLVRRRWVADQHDFYHRTAARLHRKRRWLGGLASILLGAAIVLAITEPFAVRAAVSRHIDPHWVLILIAFSLVLAGFVRGYSEKKGFAPLARRYEAMAGLFGAADHELREAACEGDVETAQRVLLEIGREALAEHAEWLLLHRDHPLEVPTG